jgi:hypothetical protein
MWFQIMKRKRAIIALDTQPFGIGRLFIELLELPLSLTIFVRSA